jgi:flagellar hook-associated protein 3 FlgL
MRVTEKIIYDSVRNSVMDNRSALFLIQQKIAENRKLIYLSDDPRSSEKASQIKTSQSEVAQFKRNILFGKASLELTENSLNGINETLVRAKELAIQMANGEVSATDRKAAAAEVTELFKQAVGYANTRLGGEYIFSGFKSDTPAYTEDGVWQGDDGARHVRIGQSEKMQINATGSSIFGDRVTSGATPGPPPATYTSGSSIMEDLAQFRSALENNDLAGIQATINAMDLGQARVLQSQASVGTRSKHMTVTDTSLLNLSTSLTGQLSDIQDLDIAQMSIDLKKQEAVLQASIAVAGRITSMTVLDAVSR